VESASPGSSGVQPALVVRVLGPVELRRGGAPVALPASRKVRALLAFLALTPEGATRSRLCDLLWDSPVDPRGELRWCLSKLRRIVDEDGRARVQARDDRIVLDLADAHVDALTLARDTAAGVQVLDTARAEALAALYAGEPLDGVDVDRSPAYAAWLASQRRRLGGIRVALLEHLATRVDDARAFAHLEQWLQFAPFDRRAHELLLAALARNGRTREAETHVERAAKLFEAEGLDAAPLRFAWRAALEGARSHSPAAPRIEVAAGPDAAASAARERSSARRASVAVMPFVDGVAAAEAGGGIADALVHDVITRLAKLRTLFVIAQGTVFALHERRVGAEAAARMLDVDYVVSGAVRVLGGRLLVDVELAETRTSRVVWAERFDEPRDGTLQVLDEIGNRVVSSIAGEIELLERNRAILKPPASLDAWEALHRGLWHMYRFTRGDNEEARRFFATAVELDPTLARAHAGLSFTHWQNAFQGWADRDQEVGRALDAAARGVLVDDRDPSVHWAQGRALWLRGDHAQSVVELEQSVDLSPNFAQAHYSLAFVQSQSGDPAAAVEAADHSRKLSPYDPLLFGMFGARAMALVRLGRYDEAAFWAVKAAARPNAHAHIFGIAAFSLALSGALDEARQHAAALRRMSGSYGIDDFLRAFRFDAEGEGRFREGARRLGVG